MNRDEFLQRIDQINVWKSSGKRAPHKPLLLLLGLGRVLNGENRLASYRNDIEPELGQLLQRFGPPRKRMHPESPFSRLSADGLWDILGSELLTVKSSGDFSVPELRNRGIEGGFPESAYHMLRNAPELIREATQRLLDGHFPESLHDEFGKPLAFLGLGKCTILPSSHATLPSGARSCASTSTVVLSATSTCSSGMSGLVSKLPTSSGMRTVAPMKYQMGWPCAGSTTRLSTAEHSVSRPSTKASRSSFPAKSVASHLRVTGFWTFTTKNYDRLVTATSTPAASS